MKTKKTNWKRISAAVLVTLISTMVIFYSCEKDNIQAPNQNSFDSNEVFNDEKDDNNNSICGVITHRDLIDVNNRKLGTVTISNDSRYLYINVYANKGRGLASAYLYTGSREDLPMDFRGDLEFKSFNNSVITEFLVRRHNFKVPLVGLDRNFIISLMVQASDSPDSSNPNRYIQGWANGKAFGELGLGRAFYYKKSICLDPADPIDFEQ